MKVFIIFLIFTIALSINVSAQILYTDIVPDYSLFVINNSQVSKKLDINQDGIDDFRITISSWIVQVIGPTVIYNEEITISSIDTNSRIGFTHLNQYGGGCNYITVDSGNLILDNEFYWKNYGKISGHSPLFQQSCGPESGKKYIAVKLFLDGSYYIGWIAIDQNYIFDMAINLSNQMAIIAGSIEEPKPSIEVSSIIGIYPTATIDKLEIVSTPNQIEKYSLYNCSGQLLKSFYLKIDGKFTLDISDLSGGIYILINHKSGKATKIMKMEKQDK